MEKSNENELNSFFEKLKKDSKGEKILEKIENSLSDGTENLGYLIDDVLSIAKIEGHNFSKEEIFDYLQEEFSGISDEALKMASGGAKRFGGGDFGKGAALFAGTAGLGGLGMAAFSGNIFGGNGKDAKKDNTASSKKQTNKNKDKKSVQKGLDDSLDEDIGGLSSARSKKGGTTSSKLKGGLRRRSPDFDPYSYGGGSSYGPSYGSRRRGRSGGSAEKLQSTLLEFLERCSGALRSKGLDLSPEDLYGAIMNGTLENALGNSATDFIMALQSGDVDSAVNLVVSALTKDMGTKENAAQKIQSDPKYRKLYEGLKDGGKGMSPKDYEEMMDKFLLEEEDYKKQEKNDQKKEEEEREEKKENEEKDKKDKPEDKKEEKKEEVENKADKPVDKEEEIKDEENKQEKQENKDEEKIKVVQAEFLGDEAKQYPVKSFDFIYFNDDVTKEEITQWFNKIKEETKEERAIMCSGEKLKEIKSLLKSADKDVVICENKKLGENQFVVIFKDSEDKKVEEFFKNLKKANINIKGENINKSGDLKLLVDGTAKEFKEKKENEKKAKENRDKEKLQKYKEEIKRKLLDEKLAELKIKKVKSNEEPRNMLIVNTGAEEEKIKEKIDNNDVIIEVLDEKGNSKLGDILNKENWKEVEQKVRFFGFFGKDKDKNVKIYAKKSVTENLGEKNQLIGEYYVIADFSNNKNNVEKKYNDLGSIEDFMKAVKENNTEDNKIKDIKKEIDEKNKAAGRGENDIPKELLKKVAEDLKGKKALKMPVTIGVKGFERKVKALFLPENNYIKAEDIPADCDVIVKKGNSEKDLKDINKRRGILGYIFDVFYRKDKELRGVKEFVPIGCVEHDKNGKAVNGGIYILVRKGVLSNYISSRNGDNIIKEYLTKTEEWVKMRDKYENNIDKYYMEIFNPEKEEYYDNIFGLSEKCKDLAQILNEFADNIKVKEENYDYEDYCDNFLEILNYVNKVNKQ